MKDKIEWVLIEKKISYSKEFKFLPNRKFRFDFYLPDFLTGIEYEGIISAKSRHTSLKGFTTDCEKYNLAQINGYTVLRYTALNVSEFSEHLEMMINFKRNDLF